MNRPGTKRLVRDPLESARVLARKSDDAGALALLEEALKAPDLDPDRAVSLRLAAARAARVLADAAAELGHLEAAEGVANLSVPGRLGGVRYQLGMALERHGQYGRAVQVLDATIPLLADDPELAERAKEAAAWAHNCSLSTASSRTRDAVKQLRVVGLADEKRERALRLGNDLRENRDGDSFRDLVGRLLAETTTLLEAHTAALVTVTSAGGQEVVDVRDAEGRAIPNGALQVSRTIVARVLAEKRGAQLMHLCVDEGSKSARRLKLTAVCGIPLRYKGGTLGVLVADRRGCDQAEENPFKQCDAIVIEALGRFAADLVFQERRATLLRVRDEITNDQYARASAAVRARFRADAIVGSSPALVRALDMAAKLAPTDVPVLLRGETGTGKELFAQALHANSRRSKQPIVSVNVATIAPTLLESELFGSVKGAFTGALNKAGLVQQAHGSTLFLDEIGEASPAVQAALLRLLQEKEIRPVGAEEAVKVDVRVIAATHRPLEDMIASGLFRQDLYYRLNTATLSIPPLRERREDIPIMVERFCAAEKRPGVVSDAAIKALMERDWPGNVRDLRNAVLEMIVTERPMPKPKTARRTKAEVQETLNLAENERKLIKRALEDSGGVQKVAAQKLGITARGLQKKIARLKREPADRDVD